jgi:hypothetical protein
MSFRSRCSDDQCHISVIRNRHFYRQRLTHMGASSDPDVIHAAFKQSSKHSAGRRCERRMQQFGNAVHWAMCGTSRSIRCCRSCRSCPRGPTPVLPVLPVLPVPTGPAGPAAFYWRLPVLLGPAVRPALPVLPARRHTRSGRQTWGGRSCGSGRISGPMLGFPSSHRYQKCEYNNIVR